MGTAKPPGLLAGGGGLELIIRALPKWSWTASGCMGLGWVLINHLPRSLAPDLRGLADELAGNVPGMTADAGWGAGRGDDLSELCARAVVEVPASGVAVTLITVPGPSATVAVSDEATRTVEELQTTLGEGPCVDAFRDRRPVLVPDLLGGAAERWPAYCPAAHEQGVRAAFAFPLQVGAARLGVLDVYRDVTGPLPTPDLIRALAFAAEATSTLLQAQEDAGEGRVPAIVDQGMTPSLELFQAQGMVMVQLGVSLDAAIARLRAYAYANERTVTDVARAIVAQGLRLDND